MTEKMTYDDVMDAYYFVESKAEPLDELFEEYPMLFSKEAITPLNFQLRMSEIANNSRTSQRYSQNRIRLSTQTAVTKMDLRMKMMATVLCNREKYNIFESVMEPEDIEESTWLYVDRSNSLNGPVTAAEMNLLFIDQKLTFDTRVKTKMASDFTLVCHILNKFCRKTLVKKFETAENLEDVMKKEKAAIDPNFKLNSNPKLEPWLKVIGKRPDVGRTSFSMRASFKVENEKQCLSVTFKKPDMYDAKSIGNVKD